MPDIVGPKDKERLQENMIDLGLFVLQTDGMEVHVENSGTVKKH